MAAVCINHIDISDDIMPRLQYFFIEKISFYQRRKNNFSLFMRQIITHMVFIVKMVEVPLMKNYCKFL